MIGITRTQELPVLLLGAVLSNSAVAQTEINPNVFSGISYLSNVFKLDGETEAALLLEGEKLNDFVKEYGASLDADIDYKQQTANFQFQWKSHHYNQFEFLDNDSRAFSTRWWGRLGGPVMAGFNYEHRTELTDYSEISRAIDFKNEKQQDSVGGRLRFELSGKWRLEAESNFFRARFSHESYSWSNQDNITVQGGVSFQRSPMKTVRFIARAAYHDYIDREFNDRSVVDSQHYSYDAFTAISWSFAGASVIDMKLGMRQRKHVHLTERNVIGPLADVSFRWAPGTKYLFSLSYRYEKEPVERVLTNYATVNEVTVASKIRPLHHLSANVSGTRRWYDYRDGSDDVQRSDYQVTGVLEINYLFREHASTGVFVSRDFRESNIQYGGYDSVISGVNISLIL